MTSDARKRELKAQFKAAEQQQLLDSLPFDIPTLKDLLSYLDTIDSPCNHTLQQTCEFLEAREIDPDEVIPWLQAHGGGCDCQVIGNVYGEVGDLVGWHLEEGDEEDNEDADTDED